MFEENYMKRVRQGTRAFLSGGFGGACLVLVGHPLDLVKVNMQTMPKPLPGQVPIYTGIWDCLAKTFAKDGIFGLYRGMSAPLIAVAPNFATCFLGYDIGIKLARYLQKTPEDQKTSLVQYGFAGAFSAFPTVIVLAPGDRIKCLLQAQAQDIACNKNPKYKGFYDCGKQLYRSGGWASIFKGWEATLIREIPCSIGYFVSYEGIKRLLTPKDQAPEKLNPLSVVMAGGCAGIVNWIIAIPPDVIKSRIQTAPEGKYRGFIHCYQLLIKEEGYMALFKGFQPAIIRAFPSSAACWFGVEVSRKFLLWLGLD